MVALVFFCMLALLAAAHAQNIQVVTTEGTIEGFPATDGNYHTFHGIPYAQSRTGSDRFKVSSPPPELPGLLYAYETNVLCARPTPDGNFGIENCLILNIFTNDVATSKPVLVWLNGEEHNASISTQYSYRRYIEEEGLVVVTLNYRLTIYGSLCLKTSDNPGNAGLKDIILGLQWIQKNIAAFGGNPNNVLLMGHGSAAAMVDLVTMSPKSESLVHKAIALSGTAVAPWAVSYDPIGAAVTLMDNMGYFLQSIDDVIIHLTGSTSLNDISDAINKIKYTNNTQMFAPCIEESNEDAVLTDSPINLLRAGNYRHIPYIAGYVTKEGTQRVERALSDEWLSKMQANFIEFLPVDLNLGESQVSVAEDIRNFYFGNNAINITTIENYFHYHGDTIAVMPAIRGVRERAATSTSEVRLLEFGYMGTNNSDWNHDEIPLNGVRHGGILNYIFDFDLKAEDENVRNSIVKKISTFAHTGIPTSTAAEWPVVTDQSIPYYYYGGSSESPTHQETTLQNPQADKMTFWDRLYNDYYFPPGSSSATKLMGLLSVILFSFVCISIL